MTESLTLVELGRTEFMRGSLLFGTPCDTFRASDTVHMAVFRPGQILGYERWRGNAYGTISRQVFVVKCMRSGKLNPVTGIHPGAELLFHARGKVAAQRLCRWVSSLQTHIHSIENISETRWRWLSNRHLIREGFPLAKMFLTGAYHAEA